ncbi:DUF5343 domain-containing protein [Cognatishimia sp. WU-CL00825]|uniref:DUF5343 domain-containing protein n=1 Tax=Cognatishimia sp. WU-CL00825 TaxID=3127658 RepID=UPI003365954E
MATLPYVTSSGNIEKVLTAIKAAAVPERVNQDFVKTILKIPGGSGNQMTTYLKKIGFAESDGRPTEIYTRFRNPTSSGRAVAEAIRFAYAPLYIRNEYMHELTDDELIGLLVEETGQARDSNPVKMGFSCIKSLKQFAKFDEEHVVENSREATLTPLKGPEAPRDEPPLGVSPAGGIGLNLGYTINLNLPASSDPAVFNAIFKSLKENLLRDDDA